MSDLERIKSKFQKIDSRRWWGDDNDVRFFLLNILKKIENSIIIDIGGGIGIILSELNKNNLKINVDLSLSDLSRSKKEFPDIETICASMNYLPIKKNSTQFVICANILEVAKTLDINNKNFIMKNNIMYYKTVIQTLKEINTTLEKNGKLYLTTPNNKYYKTTKLNYNELNESLLITFDKFSIKLFNTYLKLSNKYRKLNLANIIPKIKSKVFSRDKVLSSLIKNKIGDKYSVSFFVEAEK
ncbi:MAG: hypothetical protein CXT78_00655 [Thaumarchaeota archaeon]|jgi:ubiquinone/menaquinone biosynthesis C-methylase UbiE|nr:MAG: hypothetical protein CXT78_00655 [Nitrososphaerota archaeon]